MLTFDPYLAELLAKDFVNGRLKEAKTWQLCRQARPHQRNWLFRHVCPLLFQLGRVLVTLGRRLQRYGTTAGVALAERSGSNEVSAGGGRYGGSLLL